MYVSNWPGFSRIWRRIRALESRVAAAGQQPAASQQPAEPQPPERPEIELVDQVMAAAGEARDIIEVMAEATVLEPDAPACHLLLGDSIARDAALQTDGDASSDGHMVATPFRGWPVPRPAWWRRWWRSAAALVIVAAQSSSGAAVTTCTVAKDCARRTSSGR